MAMGLIVGGIFLGATGSKLARNYFSTDDDTKTPIADVQRKVGVTERIMANPNLLAQYNEKYVAKKLQNNSAMTMGSEKVQVARTMSLKRTASTGAEREKHESTLNKLMPQAAMGA